MSQRSDAFVKPLPPDWQPQVGERVYLNYGKTAAYGDVRAALLPDLFIVRYFNGGPKDRQFLLKDLRPHPIPFDTEQTNGDRNKAGGTANQA